MILDLTSLEKSEIKYKINEYPDGQKDIIIYENGAFYNTTTLTEIRERVAANVRNTINVSVHS